MVVVKETSTPGLNGSIEIARFAAAVGIVIFHLRLPGEWIGLMGLPFFMMLAAYFSSRHEQFAGFAATAARLAKRLLLPWLIWSAVYGAAKLADAIVSGTSLADEFQPWMLLTGPAIHLWYLPFAFMVCLAIQALAARFPNHATLLPAVLIVLAAAVVAAPLGVPGVQATPFTQWLFVTPSAILGLAVGLSSGNRKHTILTLGVIVAALLASGLLYDPYVAVKLAIASSVFIATTLLPTKGTSITPLLAPASFAIYLSHPMIAAIFSRVLPKVPYSSWIMLAICILLPVLFVVAFHASAASAIRDRWLGKTKP